MGRFNLKAKFAVVTAAMLLTVAGIITAFLTNQQEQTIREELLRRAVALTESLAYNCQLPLAVENKTSLRRLAQGLFKDGEIGYVLFQNTSGAVVYQCGVVTEGGLDIVQVKDTQQHTTGTRSTWIRSADARTYLDVQTPVLVETSDEEDILATRRNAEVTPLGLVRVGLTTAAAEKRIAHMQLLAGLIGVAIALAGSILAAGLIHVMTRPLSRLMEGNRRLARGDYTMRLEVRSRDEFGRLAGSYNQMVEEIQRSRELAESYLASLRANAERLEETNRALQHTNDELAKASRMKSEFLAVMSHELRTPLNVIIGFSEVLLDQKFGDMNSKQTRYANNILSSGRHLLSLINDILDLSKVEAGRMQVAPEPFDLRQCLEEIQSLVRNLSSKKGIEVKCADVPAVTPVTDQKLFKQVMLNLLSNAIKFTPENGSVRLGIRCLDGKLLRADAATRLLPAPRRKAIVPRRVLIVEVRDTGVGIDPEDHSKLFQAFQQLDASYARKQEGTGLGLALTRRIVVLLGGDIWFESVRGQGSTFWFYVPFELSEEDGPARTHQEPIADRLPDAPVIPASPAPVADPRPVTERDTKPVTARAHWPWGEPGRKPGRSGKARHPVSSTERP